MKNEKYGGLYCIIDEQNYFDIIMRPLLDFWIDDEEAFKLIINTAHKCHSEFKEYIIQYENEVIELKNSGCDDWVKIVRDKTEKINAEWKERIRTINIMKLAHENKM